MLPYKQVFKTLTNLTNTKLSSIAYSLGYDVSYISKWNSGKKLPSYKNISEINGKLSSIFSKSLIKEKKVQEFLVTFNIKNSQILKENTEKSLEVMIYKLLNDSYDYTNTDSYLESPLNTHFIFKNNNVENEFKDIFEKLILENDHLDIWASFDILNSNSSLLFNVIKNTAKKNNDINLHLLCSKENLYKIDILKTITENSKINIELYQNNKDINYNLILIKDKMYMLLNNENEDFFTITYGNEMETLFEFSIYINNLFKNFKKIISLSSPEQMAKTNYRKYFYSDNEFLFLSNFGFEFLMPNTLIDKILNSLDPEDEVNRPEILDIKFLWDKLFINSKIDFITTRTALINYFETGEILYCSKNLKLNSQDIKDQFKNIIFAMKNNKNINFYIINDERFLKPSGLDKFNFFVNENNMYFKKVNLKSSLSPISIVSDVKIHKNISEILHKMIESSCCKKYNASDIEKVFQKYWDVFYKIPKK